LEWHISKLVQNPKALVAQAHEGFAPAAFAQSSQASGLEGRHRELGEDHPETLESKNDLAVLYKEQSRYDEAEKLLLKALEGRRLRLGDTHIAVS